MSVDVVIGKYQWTVVSTDPQWSDWRDSGEMGFVEGVYCWIAYRSRSWNCVLEGKRGTGGVTLHQREDGSVHSSHGWGRLQAAPREALLEALSSALGIEVL